MQTTSTPAPTRSAGRQRRPNRHLPRLCRTCEAPMAGQEATCWRCGSQWVAEPEPRTRLRLVEAPDDVRGDELDAPLPAVAAAQGRAW
jgi:predicted amidophosphoribosyltransferase